MTNVCLKCAAPIKQRRKNAKYCSSQCCSAASSARFASRQTKEVRAQWRKYFYTPRGTITALLGNAKDRAKKVGVPFALSREWVAAKLEIGICEMSGIPLVRAPRGKTRTHPFAPSLDRIIPSLGYIEANVRLVAFAVNQARSDFGDEILVQIAHALVAKQKKGPR